jgi:thiamine kinase-like enzyme
VSMGSGTGLQSIHPRAFTLAELTAGLRSFAGDPWLRIVRIQPKGLRSKRLSAGRIYALNVVASDTAGTKTYPMVIKEPRQPHRAGMAGSGSREVAFYKQLSDQVPIRVPGLIAAHKSGEWMALEVLKAQKEPEKWDAPDYLLAVEKLALLHDRFWNLENDLENYTWLVRPLNANFKVHIKLALDGHLRLLHHLQSLDGESRGLAQAFQLLVDHIDQVADTLHEMPFTLLHGDFWPGNLCLCSSGDLAAYDWENAAIGPPVLDLAGFVYQSLWAFGDLPLPASELAAHYRSSIAHLNGYTWEEETWNKQWDSALLWIFLTGWLSMLSDLPDPVMQMHQQRIQKIWLDPVKEAVFRQNWQRQEGL